MPAGKMVWKQLKPEDLEVFLSYLDTLPEEDRPIYGIQGKKASAWEKLGGGTSRIIVLFYPDRAVFSMRGLTGVKEKSRIERPLSDIVDVRVVAGPLLSSVAFTFRDGSKTKLANVAHKEAAPLTRFMAEGEAALDRSRLDPESLTAFFYACNHGLPLPDDLFTREPRDVAS